MYVRNVDMRKKGDQEISSSGPIRIRVPQVENPRPERRSPVRNRQVLDTPTPGPSPRKQAEDERAE